MAIYIEMPKLGDTMTEGTLLKWRKNEGDKVEAGDVLAEVETDKATMEMEAFDDGILHKQLVAAGWKVADRQQDRAAPAKGRSASRRRRGCRHRPRAPTAAKADTTAPAPKRRPERAAAAPAAPKGRAATFAEHRARQSFAAREKDRGVQGRRTLRSDRHRPGRAHRREGCRRLRPPPLRGEDRGTCAGRRHSRGRRGSAHPAQRHAPRDRRALAPASKTTIPHFYLNIEVDAGPLMKLRAEANAASEAAGGPKITVNDFVLKAVIAAAVKVPAVNASFAGDAIIQYGSVNLSVAVAVEEGLVTPGHPRCAEEIAARNQRSGERPRDPRARQEAQARGIRRRHDHRLQSRQLRHRVLQRDHQSAAGAHPRRRCDREKSRSSNHEDQIVVGQRMAIGLSADHRVVDGAVGAQYLAELRKFLESPTLMLL